jgi:chemotaxis protein MotB
MAGSSDRRRGRGGLDAWPGYVDALATLLMVIIFVLLVFVLAQGFLSVALSSRDRALDRLNRQVAELAELLALERGQAEELRTGLARATAELATAAAARDTAQRSMTALRDERDRLLGERDTARSEQERLAARLSDLGVAGRGTADRVATLERQLAEALARAEAVGGDVARTTRDLTDTRRGLQQTEAQRAALEQRAAATAAELAAARATLEALRAEAASLNRQVTADRATIEARLADLARLNQQVQALTALRDELERQAQAALARAGEEERGRRAAEQAAAEATRRREAAEGLAAAAAARAGASEAEARAAAQRAGAAETARRDAEAAMRDAVTRAATAEQARQRAEDIARQAATVQAAAERARADAEREAAARITAAERARVEADALRANAGAAQATAVEQTRLADSARAQVALLTRQVEALRAEIARLVTALELEEAAGRDREAQISVLGQRLNAALAARVEELQRYRSNFFGRLREVLGERPEVRIVGDRFVFQGEVLFAPAQAELSEEGRRQVRDLARVLLEIAPQIPQDIAWVLRVDGHADRTPIRSPRFASNWELAAARAIAVAQLLIAEGLPANRVAAASFGDTQPIDAAENPAAYARNRRIELRLTDR